MVLSVFPVAFAEGDGGKDAGKKGGDSKKSKSDGDAKKDSKSVEKQDDKKSDFKKDPKKTDAKKTSDSKTSDSSKDAKSDSRKSGDDRRGGSLFDDDGHSTRTRASRDSFLSFDRDIDFDRDTVLLALALGPGRATRSLFDTANSFLDIPLVASGSASIVARDDRFRDVDLDEGDVFALLAFGERDLDVLIPRSSRLGGIGLGSGFGDCGLATRGFDRDLSQRVTQRVDLDRDDVLLALALDRNGFDVLDQLPGRISRTLETSDDLRTLVDFDEDDVLLGLALDRDIC
ncbi:MAG TPA: hypothetical protein VM889_01595 [Candidatus Thermoplasmatota archaeon]|nr:hypothetical protein [Candidatus Thermoplasmatota archaeon]